MSIVPASNLQGIPGQRRASYIVLNSFGGRKQSIQFFAKKPLAEEDEDAGEGEQEDVELVYVPPRLAAVVLRDADKKYKGGESVLHGFNMSVEHGTIYTVFGESGSGKTTLLAIIAGARSLTRGKCLVYGKPPGSRDGIVPGKVVGYMPQENSLYPELTISETLTYFGTLYGRGRDAVKEAVAELASLLQLPDQNQLVGTLSGGQQRRTSLALALIHKPDLLILDEPTVGLDPLLVRKVWDHLVHLVETRQTTVIVSTVTPAEARKSNMIGIIRNGCLLAERSPDDLMSEFGTTELDEAVLKLCKRDDKKYLVMGPPTLKGIGKGGNMDDIESFLRGALGDDNMSLLTVTKPAESFIDNFKMRFKALFMKDTTVWRRNFYFFFFLILTPSLVCFTFGNSSRYRCHDMPFGVVDLEGKPAVTYGSKLTLPEDCDLQYLSCQFLSKIDPEGIKLKLFATEDEAVKEVEDGKIHGFLRFPENFTMNIYERIASGPEVSELLMDKSDIKVRMDQTNKIRRSEIMAYFHEALLLFYQTILKVGSGGDFDPAFVSSTLRYGRPVYGENVPVVLEFSVGTIPSVISFFPIIGTAIHFIGEKRRGTQERSLVAGVKPWEMMIAQSIVDLFVLGVQTSVVYFLVLKFLFDIDPLGNQFLAFILCFIIGLSGMSLGYFLGFIFSEEVQAAIIAYTFLVPNMILTGGVWPLEGLPEWLKTFAHFLPITRSIKALRAIMAKGWDLSHPEVWPGFAIPFGYTILFLALTTALQTRKLIKS